MRSLKINHLITIRNFSSLDRYFAEIGKLPIISVNEEVILARRIKEGDQKALLRLVNGNLRFVVSVAKQFHKGSFFSLGDLINEGNLGLIRAAQRYDETRGFKFISYAVWWIRQSIMQAITQQNKLIRLPLNRVNEMNQIHKVSNSLEQKLGRVPTAEEISDLMKLNSKKIRNIQQFPTQHFSLDAPMAGSDGDLTLIDVLEDVNSKLPESALFESSLNVEIEIALAKLNPIERSIIIMYFGLLGREPMSLSTIGVELGLSQERIRQIKRKSLSKMKQKLNHSDLQSYLNNIH